MRLEGKKAVVTGGGSGIGRATALLFAREGATVAINDIDEEAAQKTVAEIGSGFALPGDVADPAAVGAAFEEAASRFGTLDVLVNCAGIAEVAGMDTEDLTQRVQTRIGEAMSGQRPSTHLDVTRTMTDDAW